MKTTIIAIMIMGLTSPIAFADDSDKKGVSKFIKKYSLIKDQIDTNSENINVLTTRIDNLPAGGGGGTGPDPQVQTNTTAISNLNTQVQTNTGNISGNAAQIQGNTGNINSASAEAQANTALNATQTTQIQANAASNAAQDNLIQSNTAANTAQDTLIQTNTTSVNNLTTSSQAMQGSVDTLTNQVSTIQSDVNVQGTQVQTNTDGIASNTARITALENGGGGGPPPPPPPSEPPVTPTIDFTLYIPNAATKNYQYFNNGACDTVIQTITRVDDATGSDITINETLRGGLGICTVFDRGFRLTATNFAIVSYNDSIVNPNITYEAPGGDLLNNTMQVGMTFGFALAGVGNPLAATIQKNTILSIEPSVTVPAGTFTNCLKMSSNITSSFIIPNAEQVSWLCEGIGEVKRMFYDRNTNRVNTMNLSSFTQ